MIAQQTWAIPRRWQARPIMLWVVYGAMIVHALLLITVPSYRHEDSLAGRSVYLCIIAIGIGYMIRSQPQTQPRVRWAWRINAIAIGGTILINMAAYLARRNQTPLPDTLVAGIFLGAYVLALIADTSIVPERWWKQGNARRIIIESLLVGCATLAILQSLIPPIMRTLELPWNADRQGELSYLAFDITMLFAIGLIRRWYGEYGNPQGRYSWQGLLCLLFSDMCYIGRHWLPDGGMAWMLLGSAFYGPFVVLLGYGSTLSVTDPPKQLEEDVGALATIVDEILWSYVPRLLFGLALALTLWVQPPDTPGLITILFLIAIAREVVATSDTRRVGAAWRQSMLEREARMVVRLFQHELKTYTSALHGYLPILRRILPPHDSDAPGSINPGTVMQNLDRIAANLDTLVRQLLILSGPTTPGERPQESVALDVLVRELAATIVPTQNITINVPTGLVTWGHRIDLALALGTALQNAHDAVALLNPAVEAYIGIQGWRTGKHIFIRIEDNGPGFSEEVLEALQQTLKRGLLVGGITSKPGGHGLGLVLIDRVAHNHGGSMTFGNLPYRRGAWIEITLAAMQETPEALEDHSNY